MAFAHRLATREDVSSLEPMVSEAIDVLQRGYLDSIQIAASHAIMGIDTELIDDGTRRGVGRLILTLCEKAAAAEGFSMMQLHATLAGLPLYRAYGFEALAEITIDSDGVPIPC